MPSLVDLVLEHAEAEADAGVKEVGGNDCGPRVGEYLESVGLPQGNPWCAAFVNFNMKAAGVRGWPPTGDTWAIQDWARQHGCYHDTDATPERGDVALFIGSDGQPYHTGLVTGPNADGTFNTIEGNTHDQDGDPGPKGVHHRTHNHGVAKFVRWSDVLH